MSRTHLFLCVLVVLVGRRTAVAAGLHLSSRVVTTRYGSLRGYIAPLSNRQLQPVEVFLGVPYASPPVGSLRFMPPVTPPFWRGVRLSDRYAAVCPQILPDVSNETEALRRMPAGRVEYLKRILPYLRNQSEDCLYLNIYVPSVVSRDGIKVPVLVFIHGESYEWNSGNPYDGSVLSSFGNIVVVTLNFRLGVFGFLPSLDGRKGNYGLMDQIAALHWIQENIAEFGGDPANVTLFGQGHGAACAHILMLSPIGKSLFNRVILQSGSVFSPWSIARDSISFTRTIAHMLGCSTIETTPMLECLRQRPAMDILRVRSELQVPRYLTAFGPTIDGIVLPKSPEQLIKTQKTIYSKYDLLFGVTRIESYYHFSTEEERHGITPDRRDRLLRTLVRNLFNYHLREIFLTIVNEYTDWTRPLQHPQSIFDGLVDALGDALVVAPIVDAGNRHAEVHARTFFYVFLHQTENGEYSNRLGCIHGEDLTYVFGAPLVHSLGPFASNYTRAEMGLAEMVMMYWTSFVKAGDPNAYTEDAFPVDESGRGRIERFVWPQYDTTHKRYLAIALKPKVRDHYHVHRLSYWLDLIPKLHQPGLPHLTHEHHLLDDHDNIHSYDGIVRQVPVLSPSDVTTTPVPPPLEGLNPRVTTEATRLTSNTPTPTSPASTTPVFALSTEVVSTANQSGNATTSGSEHSTSYSTALSLTIAIGSSLLVLNILIFAGVYYQRDKSRHEARHHKRNFQTQCTQSERGSFSEEDLPPPYPSYSMNTLPSKMAANKASPSKMSDCQPCLHPGIDQNKPSPQIRVAAEETRV